MQCVCMSYQHGRNEEGHVGEGEVADEADTTARRDKQRGRKKKAECTSPIKHVECLGMEAVGGLCAPLHLRHNNMYI